MPSLFNADTTEPTPPLPASWRGALAGEFAEPYFQKLQAFVAAERGGGTVFPPEADVCSALRLTPLERVKVLILGQDPYHGPGQAHGLAFSVRPGVPAPPSLVNMFKELRSDVGCAIPNHGSLIHWAEQGVLLLNAVLTVRLGEPNSHQGKGWEKFTDAVIRHVSAKSDPVVFILWGGYAQKKEKLIDAARHSILKGPHPSPLSVHRGFFGSRPFSKTNQALHKAGKAEIDWCIPNL